MIISEKKICMLLSIEIFFKSKFWRQTWNVSVEIWTWVWNLKFRNNLGLLLHIFLWYVSVSYSFNIDTWFKIKFWKSRFVFFLKVLFSRKALSEVKSSRF